MRVELNIVLPSSQVSCILFHFSLFPLSFQYPNPPPQSTNGLNYEIKILYKNNLVPHSKALHLHYRDWLSNILSIISNYSRYFF